MTTPNPEYPKGALTGVAGSSARSLQSVTQQDAINSLRGPVDESFGWFQRGVRSMLAGVVNFFGGGLLGDWRQVRPEDIEIRDGQLALNGRTDLLDGVRGYASAYQSLNVRSGPGWIFNGFKWRFLPFAGQLGPVKGAAVIPEGMIRIDEPGLWTVYATIYKDDVVGVGPETVILDCYTARELIATEKEIPEEKLLRRMTSTDSGIVGSPQTASITYSVVVDQAPAYVGVSAACVSDTWFLGGTLYSNLFVVKHDNRAINPGEKTVPNETSETT